MTTLHMQTETVRNTALEMKRSSEAMSAEMQATRASIQRLGTDWNGDASAEFQSEAEALLRQLVQQQENLLLLAERVSREVQEWEDVDNRGASSIQGMNLEFLRNGPGGTLFNLPYAGGSGNVPFYSSAVLPLFTSLSILPFFTGLPAWLNSFIDKFFPPPTIISPIVETPFPETTESPSTVTTPLGELNKQPPPQATESAQPAVIATPAATPEATESAKPVETESPASIYDTYYDIPAKSQGTEYGSAACLPTSMSMVLDHFHNADSDLKTATPGELVKMLDKGDGTSGSGVGLDKLNDDLAELGYQSNVTKGSMEDLSTQLKDGPVIVNAGVKLLSVPTRDIASTPGATNHAMLVKAINADSVVVNDPWSGAEKVFPRETFEKLWNKGDNFMVTVRPQEKQ